MSRLQEELEKLEFVAVDTDGGSSSYCSSFQVVGLHGVTEDFELKYYNVAVAEVSLEHTAKNFWKNTFQKLGDFGANVKIVTTTTDYEKKMLADFNHEERTGCIAHLRLAR